MKLQKTHILCKSKEKNNRSIEDIISKDYEIIERWQTCNEEGCSYYFITTDQEQDFFDALEELTQENNDIKIIFETIESFIPEDNQIKKDKEKENCPSFFDITNRDEMINIVTNQSRLNGSYLILVFLSTIVATIALTSGNIAALIGAMVLTPLLGPNLALALATAVSDKKLLLKSVYCGISGFVLTFIVSYIVGHVMGKAADKSMVPLFVSYGFETIPLAVCAGVAATTLLLQGTLSPLIGVMVAVAFLPPIAMSGLSLSNGDYFNSLNSFLLFLVNLAAFNIAAKLVLLFAGIKPLNKQLDKRRSLLFYIAGWFVAICVLSVGIYFKN